MDRAKDPISGLWYRPHTWDLDSIRRAPEVARAIEPGDVVLDLGAHIGGTAWAAVQAGAERVRAVEPHPVGFEILEKNVDLLNADILVGRVVRAMPLNVAVGANLLYENARSTIGHTTMEKPWTKTAKMIPVRSQSLAESCTPLYAFGPFTTVLCDIEGAEYTLPWLDELRTSVRVLLIEFHYRFMPAWHAEATRLYDLFTKEMGFVASDPVPPLGMTHNSTHVFRRSVP